MPSHTEQQLSPYSPEQIFDLVMDIERYPQFLPWCRAARITEQGEGYLLAELIISFKHFSESYVSRVSFTRPTAPAQTGHVLVEMVRGPFEHLTNRWEFTPTADGGTQIAFFIDFRFRSRLLEKLIGGLFSKATDKMALAFKERADALYSK
ncbi:MAG: type II toxin-antitoxin system RatA family toxin [Rickettsiales bacterium]|nr:type II toxin-antitoxin system RatA family toxin [Rickettsiales bacterium]